MSYLPIPAAQPLPPFELERFLRNEANIDDDDDVKKYEALLRKNKVNEARLHLLTEALLKEMGIKGDLDRASISEAAQKRAAGGH